MCTREVGVSLRNVVSRTIHHFSQSMLTPMLTHQWGRYWWASGHIHTPVGHAHCTSACYLLRDLQHFCLGRKVSSLHRVPPRGSTRVLRVERLYTSREDLRTLVPFRPKSYGGCRWKRECKAEATHYTLHHGTRRITQACVFTPHQSIQTFNWN